MLVDVFTHGLPVVIAVLSFWSNTERKVLLLNLGLCITISISLVLQEAWSGVLVMCVAGLSTSYRLITNKLVDPRLTGVFIVLMTSLIGYINIQTGKTSWLEILPVMTFILYRFGELYCREAGLRLCMITGSVCFSSYALINHSWGVAATESLFALTNAFYLARLQRRARLATV